MSFQLDTKDRCVERDGKIYSLTPKEFGILQFLMEHPDEVFTPEENCPPYFCMLIEFWKPF